MAWEGGPGGQEAAEAVLFCLQKLSGQRLGAEAKDVLVTAFNQAYDILTGKAAQEPHLKGLGATVAGLWLDQKDVLVFNCGDCQVYRMRYGFLDQISRDHSTVYQLYLAGDIAYDDMRTHRLSHLVTSSVQDGMEKPKVFQKRLALRPGDAFLICCDGVWEALPLEEMESCFKEKSLKEGAERLAMALMYADCQDNISFLLLEPDDG